MGSCSRSKLLQAKKWLDLWLCRWRRAQVPRCCAWISPLPVCRAAIGESNHRLLPLSCARNFVGESGHAVMEKTTTSKEVYSTLGRHMCKRPDFCTVKGMLDTILDPANPIRLPSEKIP